MAGAEYARVGDSAVPADLHARATEKLGSPTAAELWWLTPLLAGYPPACLVRTPKGREQLNMLLSGGVTEQRQGRPLAYARAACDMWGLTVDEAAELLGVSAALPDDAELTSEAAERVHDVNAIRDGLLRLFANRPSEADQWMQRATNLFGPAQSALQFMAGGSGCIHRVRRSVWAELVGN